jgi:galactan 5-O-arabinofuranosyltransferase
MHLASAGARGTRKLAIGPRLRGLLRARGGRAMRAGGPRAQGAGFGLPAAEIAVVVLLAGATAAVMHAAISASSVNARSAVAEGLGPVWAAAMVTLALGAHLVQRRATGAVRARMIVAMLAGVAAGLVMAPLMAGLHGTNQPPNTIFGGDMAFRTEYITRFAATWHLDDYTFHGLHAFYPPAWFWLAGRAASVLGVSPAWHIVKPLTIVTIGAALLLSFTLWRMVLRPAGALSAAVGSLLVLPMQTGSTLFSTQAWYSPYSCFVAVTGVAWLAATYCAVRRGDSRGRLAFLTVVGAALALCYYLLFIILVLVLLALILAPSAERRTLLRRAGAVVGSIAVLTAIFWVPLFGSLLSGSASQGHFVSSHLLQLSAGIGGPSALTALAMVAIVALVLTFHDGPTRVIAAVLVGTVLYQLLSIATLTFLHAQLQPHRAVTMMWVAYGAAVPVAFESLIGAGGLRRWASPPVLRAVTAAIVAVAIPATLVLGADQGADLAAGPFSRAAHSRPVPLAQINAISGFITKTTGKRPRALTLVADDPRILITRPYFGFLPLRARYAHPEADLPGRIGVLRAAAACATPACTTDRLTSSRFGAIDALELARQPGGFRVDGQVDGFPSPHRRVVTFRPGSFDAATWAKRDFGLYTVFVRRPR